MGSSTAMGQNNGKGEDDKMKDLEKSLADLEFRVESVAKRAEDMTAAHQKFTNEFLSKLSAFAQNFELLKVHVAMVEAQIRKNS